MYETPESEPYRLKITSPCDFRTRSHILRLITTECVMQVYPPRQSRTPKVRLGTQFADLRNRNSPLLAHTGCAVALWVCRDRLKATERLAARRRQGREGGRSPGSLLSPRLRAPSLSAFRPRRPCVFQPALPRGGT